MIRIRSKEDLDSVKDAKHRAAIQKVWLKPKTWKEDYAYVEPGQLFEEAVRRLHDNTGEVGTWFLAAEDPESIGAGLISVVIAVNDGYAVTWFMPKKVWEERKYTS